MIIIAECNGSIKMKNHIICNLFHLSFHIYLWWLTWIATFAKLKTQSMVSLLLKYIFIFLSRPFFQEYIRIRMFEMQKCSLPALIQFVSFQYVLLWPDFVATSRRSQWWFSFGSIIVRYHFGDIHTNKIDRSCIAKTQNHSMICYLTCFMLIIMIHT